MMSDPSSNFESYRSPDLDSFCSDDEPASPDVASPAPVRPAGLTVICVLIILLGVLGLGAAASGAFSIFFGEAMQSLAGSFGAQGAGNNEMMKIQQEMNSEMMGVTKKYRIILLFLILVLVAVALSLIIGAVKTLGLKPQGRSLLMTSCGIAIGYLLVDGIVRMIVSMEMAPITSSFMQRMMETNSSGPGAQAGKMMATMMNSMMYVGFCIYGAIIFGKIAFYSFTLLYLRRPKVVALFETTNPTALSP